jgi:ABC-type multidrug transport system ATPase subunit
MTATRYSPIARATDWWHGWRDGRQGVPCRRAGRISTPHRDVLIRRARDAFEHERVQFEAARAGAMELVAAAGERLRDVEGRLRAAHDELDVLEPRPDPQDLEERRPGEERRPAAVVARRRTNEHRRRRAALVRRLDALAAERALRAGELAAAQDAAHRDLEVASARVRRVHEHAHARLATYRRRLVRSHPEGSQVDWQIDIVVPRRPAWAHPEPAADEADEPASVPDDGVRRVPLNPVMVIGGAADVDVQITGRNIAGEQARLTRRTHDHLLEDLTRDGPVFVDGRQVRRAALAVGDAFTVGSWLLRIESDDELSYAPLLPPSLVVFGLSAVSDAGRATEKTRLDQMSFSQHEATVLAILGPSGAGKSSLFKALLGELRTTGGSLHFGGLDLRTHGEQIRSTIGFVPQDDSLHTTLTVQTALLFSDRLRSPHLRADRADRIAKVCDDLKLEPNRRGKRVAELSGGQRKRVSIAMELLADPQLLMLDEPTSGLDAGMDSEVMRILRRMADERLDDDRRRTIVVVTHSTDNLNQAHRVLLLAPGGSPVYFGESGRIPAQFERRNWADLMRTLGQDPTTTASWVEAYRVGPEAGVAQRAAEAAEALPTSGTPATPAAVRSRQTSRPGIGHWWRQFHVLVQRQCALLLTRKEVFGAQGVRASVTGALSVLSPVLISVAGAGAAALVTSADPWTDPAAAATALNLLVTLSMLAGQALTYGDVVAEFGVIHREHRTGVLVSAVVLSKWFVFGVLALVQAATMTAIFVAIRGAPTTTLVADGAMELFLNLAMLGIATMSSGLLVSVLATDLEVAVGMATALAISQVAFNGWTADLTSSTVLNALSWLLPTRWGFAVNAASIDLRAVAPVAPPDALWSHTSGQWTADMLCLGGLTVVYVVAAVVVLRARLSPQR